MREERLLFGLFKMHFLLIVSLVLGLSFATPSVAFCLQTTFWVSPDGSDDSSGTRLKPFLTLERARDAVRAVNESRRAGANMTVNLRGGTYRLGTPLALDWRDSGLNGKKVTYRAAPGEHPVISGSIRAENWSVYDQSLNIHRAYVGQRESRQLYVNGQRAVRAKTGSYPAGFRPAFYEILGVPLPGGIEFIPTAINPAGWRDPNSWTKVRDIEAVIITQWKMMRVPVDSVTHYPLYTPDPLDPGFKTGLIVMQEPGWTNANVFLDSTTLQPGIWSFWQVTYFENAYEFLDEPGEWYLDKTGGWLYYIPREGEDINAAEVELPVLETLVEGAGELDQPVSNLRFEGLTFAYATWLDPSGANGYVADQSGFHLVGEDHPFNIVGHDKNVVRTPGNISFRFARNITFNGNIFEHLGGAALDFDTGSQGNVIENNLFEDVSSAAIQLGGVSEADHHPQYPGQIMANNTISNNLIRGTGREYVDAAGIYIGFTQYTLISHNTIVDVPWAGIAVGWGWGLLDPGGFPGLPGGTIGMWGTYFTPTPNQNNRIVNNRIHSFLNALWDGGAVYTTGQQGTSPANALLIQGNVASGKRPKAGGNIFYTDAGSRYVQLQNNVSLDNPQGVTDFGPAPNPQDPLPYSSIPSDLNGIAYGSDKGGCRTYGDITFVGNYWLNPCFFDICPYSYNGISYPTNMISRLNKDIEGQADVPKSILRAAGVRRRPPTIPADRWILPPLGESNQATEAPASTPVCQNTAGSDLSNPGSAATETCTGRSQSR